MSNLIFYNLISTEKLESALRKLHLPKLMRKGRGNGTRLNKNRLKECQQVTPNIKCGRDLGRERRNVSTVIPIFTKHRVKAFCFNRNNSHGKCLPPEESNICLRKHPDVSSVDLGLGKGESRTDRGWKRYQKGVSLLRMSDCLSRN